MRHALLAGLLFVGSCPAALAAQQQVRGRIIDEAGKPVPDQAVLLHRVAGSSGASIGQAKSDSAGRFVIQVDTAGAADAVYFLAARWHDELYISEAFHEPIGAAERTLQVGVPGTSASALLEGGGAGAPPMSGGTSPAGPVAGHTPWLYFFAPGVVLAGLIAYLVLRGRGSVPERRRVLARIARLDLEHGGTGGEAYRRQRAELLGRLRDLTGA